MIERHPKKEIQLLVLTNTGAPYDAVINRRTAVLADLEAVVLVVRDRACGIGSKFESEMTSIGSLCTLNKRHRRFAFPFKDYGFGDITRRRAYQRNVAVNHEKFTAVRARVQEH